MIYSSLSKQQSLLILFLAAAKELLPFNPVEQISLFPWGFRVSFKKPLEGEKLLLPIMEEEMRRKQKIDEPQMFSMVPQLIVPFLKDKKATLIGSIPDMSAVDFALFDNIAVILETEFEPNLRDVGPFALYAKENVVEGFSAVDKPSLKQLKAAWSEVFTQPPFSIVQKWMADPELAHGAFVPSFRLQALMDRLSSFGLRAAERWKYKGFFGIELDGFDFKKAASKQISCYLSSIIQVTPDPLIWPQEYAHADVLLSFCPDAELQAQLERIRGLLDEMASFIKVPCTFSVVAGSKALKSVVYQLKSVLGIEQEYQGLSQMLFGHGEVAFEMHVTDSRGRKQLMSCVRIGKSPIKDELYLAFVPFCGLEKCVALLVDCVQHTQSSIESRKQDVYDRLFKPV